MTTTANSPNPPREPETLADAGLPESLVEALILKILYFRGDLYGRDLSNAVGLKLSVIEDLLEALKLRHHVQIKRSLGDGNVGAVLGLTDTGRARAREALEANQYSGPAPVPLSQYAEVVRQQRPQEGWLSRGALVRALSGMVITENLLSQIGPAISAANSLLLYGKPGNGKTFLIESLNHLVTAPIFVPHAIECQGNIVQVFDPVYHERLDSGREPASIAVTIEATSDRRWVKCRRPFIVSGGELTLDMLDLRLNENSKVYEAPFQLKANNGIYLIDDFGRQRATPAEVLNRWIVPMERRVDYLSFLTGGKMPAPFDTFLVFSTNLKPADLGDEAFLRRIQYKMLLRGPAESEFVTIFERFCAAKQIPYRADTVERFLARAYKSTGRPLRRCHPRDILTHALNLIRFERLPLELTDDLLDRSFAGCFVQDEEEGSVMESGIVREAAQPCPEYWAARAQTVCTAFGKIALFASFCNRDTGVYEDTGTTHLYPASEVAATLARMHTRAFCDWLALSMEEQREDLAAYLATPEGRSAFLSFGQRELLNIVTPPGVRPEERELFENDFAMILLSLGQRERHESRVPPQPVPLVERIA